MPSEINRRSFIRSIFGLTSALPATVQAAESRPKKAFVWCDLKGGHVGYPTGLVVPHERPGSLMKLVAAAVLVDEGLFGHNERFDCTGTYTPPHRGKNAQSVHCQFAHGQIEIVDAIALSCNCFFAHAAERLTARAFLTKARALGLSSPCAGRRAGLFPLHYEDMTGPSMPYVLGLAEDFKPGCLQLMRLAAFIALGPHGKLPVLHSSENMELLAKEKPLPVALTEKSHDILVKGMRQAVLKGTCRKLDPKDTMKVAAKTGTTPHGAKFQSHVIGFFPFEKPTNAFCLFSPSGTAQDSAIPQVREILFSTTWF